MKPHPKRKENLQLFIFKSGSHSHRDKQCFPFSNKQKCKSKIERRIKYQIRIEFNKAVVFVFIRKCVCVWFI